MAEESKKAPRAEEEEWTPLKRPLLLLGSLSLASSFVAYKKKRLNWFKTSYACACVTFGPAMVLYALPERSEQLEEKLFFLSSSSNDDNDDNRNNNRNNRNNRNDDDSSKRREEREKETKRKNKEMLERMKRVKL
tara:strand:+ start:78 stop:482 length:405 start_codon:yes stop_codon:yes gene_type:complete